MNCIWPEIRSDSLYFTFYLRVSFFHVSYSLFLSLYIFAFCISQPNPLQAINLNLFCSLQFVRVVGFFLACLLWNLLAFHFYENWWYQQTVKWAGERESREREIYRLAFRTRFLFRHSILRLFCHLFWFYLFFLFAQKKINRKNAHLAFNDFFLLHLYRWFFMCAYSLWGECLLPPFCSLAMCVCVMQTHHMCVLRSNGFEKHKVRKFSATFNLIRTLRLFFCLRGRMLCTYMCWF